MRKLVLLVILSIAVAFPASAAARPSGPLVPSTGVLFGAFVAPQWGSISKFETLVGHKMRIHNEWVKWSGGWPHDTQRNDVSSGRIPMITWNPKETSTATSAIAHGSEDGVIRDAAQRVKSFGSRIFIRFGWEMNGKWQAWGCKPAAYQDAFRHIVNVFNNVGATNAVWVWAPHWKGVCGSGGPSDMTNYYPGDGYVDWVGVSAYNRYTGTRWRSLAEMLRYKAYPAYASRKPIMVAEASSVEWSGTTKKAQWINQARADLKNMPSVAAFLWFHRGLKAGAEDRSNYLVNTSSSALSAYRNWADDSFYVR